MAFQKCNRSISILLILSFTVYASTAGSNTQTLRINSVPTSNIINNYMTNPPSSPEENFTLALAYFGEGSFREAIDYANRAFSGFTRDDQKALCYILIAQSYGAIGDYSRAAQAANEGQRLAPESSELACLRYAYFDRSGDTINSTIAKEHLMRLDPIYEQEPTIAPVVAAVVIVGMVCMTAITYAITTEEDIATKQMLADAFVKILISGASLMMLAVR